MPRQYTLGKVRYMVKAETGKSLQTTSTAQDSEINTVIDDTQKKLAAEYDWAFLKTRWSLTIPAGGRYTGFPTATDTGGTSAINFDRPIMFEVLWNLIYQPIVYGIDEIPEFNYLNSDRGMVLDPVQRWQYDDEMQFEVWPLPASSATCRFIAQRALKPLDDGAVPPVWNDAALVDLDALLVTYYAGAEYLIRQNQPNRAAQLQEKAQKRLVSLVGSMPTRTEPCLIGRGTVWNRQYIRNVPLVLVAGGGR